MEYEVVMTMVLALILWWAWAMVTERRRGCKEELGEMPPGPKGWPVVGNIFQLGWTPFESFGELAQKYGPIMTLRLGSMTTVVISSKEVAREMFKNHDVILAGRKVYESLKGYHGNEGSLVTSQYGPHWRMLRRLCTTEFFVTSRLDATRGVRAGCIDRMVQYVEEASGGGANAIDIECFLFLMTFNLFGNLMLSRDLLDPKSKNAVEFFHHAGKAMEFAAKPNLADFFPMLRWFDLQGIRRKTQFHVERVFDIASGFIKERLEGHGNEDGEEKRKDFLDVLLEFHGDGIEEPVNIKKWQQQAENKKIGLFNAGFNTQENITPTTALLTGFKNDRKNWNGWFFDITI
ncbi:hypothetical protein HHK36_019274 [Tetracentron sinense]|uniref:Cytochrome P450 n=1 Tax=Tetracentron sinense TaxID=13715 RepID=A0A834YVY5_TETSI|nr:hypothetical protein HHK36_019274 [Tetracentron sinense]